MLCPQWPAANQSQSLCTVLQENSGVLGSSIADLTSTPLVKHYIDTGNAKPIKQRAYRASHHHCQEIGKQVEEMLQNGIIEPTKADKTLGLCIDYRSLNKATIKDSYPLPHIQDTLDTLYGNTSFTTLDLLKGYHQIEVEESSREKTAFIPHVGFFQYICLLFGLTNDPASFQRLLKHVLQNYIGKFIILNIDDILIYSTTFDDHPSHAAPVLQALKVAHLKIRINKCQFAETLLNSWVIISPPWELYQIRRI